MDAKKLAGEKAIEFIENDMIVGLGTGSTVHWSILKLGELVKQGLNIKGVPTSRQTEQLANELGIPLVGLSSIDQIDLTVDGADEANPDFELIKGGGGALLREKMVASISKRMIVVMDETKYVANLGKFPLPVEVTQFGWEMTCRQIKSLGCEPKLRLNNNLPFITDNGNYILDCDFGEIYDAENLNHTLNMIPGVVENGLFVNMTDTMVIGNRNGHVDILYKS
ncbi:ribose-5-phosphate isomerase RpiA [Lederbergia wuyishanensis]|uniref:Ribose-5-phosphate isomerase A n=1 Tax=Lederbergia wuyishanensis TaxID=1347903 RepID=A0ABU0D6C9_9BACI|nr:ribose-5-phosphate isomerase RpiA [Lederbergia wuyishanensis]MCJ8008618.1 ribose-5-phosphate isomerase RpiA [Lederbergia wuyishanensis]MDQ0343966.1 ribose 5-phosphate isomerase A [Lederbergia wuyishanensis]